MKYEATTPAQYLRELEPDWRKDSKSKIDPKGVLLAGLDCGKSCIRFKKTTVIADTRIEEFIQKAIRTKS